MSKPFELSPGWLWALSQVPPKLRHRWQETVATMIKRFEGQTLIQRPRCPGKKTKVWEPTIQPWIVCAAIRRKKDKAIIVGARHFDSVMQQAIKGHDSNAELNQSWAGADQGFIDQFCRFYSRKDALQVALQNEQCLPNSNAVFELYSEDLY